ncbi:hypothetical protein DEJ34_03840 [Curtobacterium sp. MCPF17_050]|uniref:hypothetical protein n=1 Tax=Curtobacterium sp. MCPF17_050 TaxID=2175664 RepID=UPI0011B765F4|nr:hypothetical protein [Curtobacterium sp. MCPF17_050]WIB16275.1 hypothetical protein DEJ34_03840 [Curtobacterium sp. MCPF17_050]
MRVLTAAHPIHVEKRWRPDGAGTVVALILPAPSVLLEVGEARRLAHELVDAVAAVEGGGAARE